MFRRSFLAYTSTAGLTVGLPKWATAADHKHGKFSFMVPANYLLSFAPVLFASASGLFDDHGLDLTVDSGRGAAQVVQLAAAKRVDGGRTGGANYIVARVNSNANVIAFSTIAQRSPFVIVSAASAAIERPNDLVGKTVGMQSMGGSMEATLDLMLKREGIDASQVERQRVADSAASYGMVEAGRVNGFLASTSAAVKLREQNFPIATMGIDDGIPGQVYVGEETALANHPEKFAAFLKATLISVRQLLAMNDAELRDAAELMRQKFDIPGAADLDIAAADIKANRDLWRTEDEADLLRCRKDQWAQAEQALLDAGSIDHESSKPLYTDDIWQLATA